MKQVQVKDQKYEEKSCNACFSNEGTLAKFKTHDKTIFTTNRGNKNNLTPIISHHPLRSRVHVEETLARLLAWQVMYVLQPRSLSFETLLRVLI
jgi:hypothetical protein